MVPAYSASSGTRPFKERVLSGGERRRERRNPVERTEHVPSSPSYSPLTVPVSGSVLAIGTWACSINASSAGLLGLFDQLRPGT